MTEIYKRTTTADEKSSLRKADSYL